MFSFRILLIVANLLLIFALSGCGGEEKTPIITSITPSSGTVATTVTIIGNNFAISPSNNIISFNGKQAVVTSSTETEIVTAVPPGATTGLIYITHNGLTATSTTIFTVI